MTLEVRVCAEKQNSHHSDTQNTQLSDTVFMGDMRENRMAQNRRGWAACSHRRRNVYEQQCYA